mmetsp:Transcript_23299/g.22902  ORF Transcript_23299/g.22902 Transcript_23299/m.22902 type:complete len:231 (+) Transcript_23299:665-1357(+)
MLEKAFLHVIVPLARAPRPEELQHIYLEVAVEVEVVDDEDDLLVGVFGLQEVPLLGEVVLLDGFLELPERQIRRHRDVQRLIRLPMLLGKGLEGSGLAGGTWPYDPEVLVQGGPALQGFVLNGGEEDVGQEVALGDLHGGDEQVVLQGVVVQLQLVLQLLLQQVPLQPLRVIEDIKQCRLVPIQTLGMSPLGDDAADVDVELPSEGAEGLLEDFPQFLIQASSKRPHHTH